MKYHSAEEAIYELREHFLLHLDSVVQHMIGEDPEDLEEWEKYKVQFIRVRKRLLHPKVMTVGGAARTLGRSDFEETSNATFSIKKILCMCEISNFQMCVITCCLKE